MTDAVSGGPDFVSEGFFGEVLCVDHSLSTADFKGDKKLPPHLPERHGYASVKADPPWAIDRLGSRFRVWQ